MANKLYVTEYANVLGASGTQQGEALPSPALASQVVTIGGTAGVSTTLNPQTRMVVLTADTACCIAVGVGAVAVATGQFLPIGGMVKFAVTPDMVVSAITP